MFAYPSPPERVTSPCSPSRPPVATALLAKFEGLHAHNKKLENENLALRDRLALVSECISSTASTSLRDLSDVEGQKHATFESFCEGLSAMGVDVKAATVQSALEELHTSVQQQEVQISKKGVRLLQEYSVVRVYLLANIAGSEQCLIEHDRLDLRSGKQTTLMIPLEIRMRGGEAWRDSARRGLHTMVGLTPEWQDGYLVIDESSHFCTTEEHGSVHDENPLDSLVSVEVHEVQCRVRTKFLTGGGDRGSVMKGGSVMKERTSLFCLSSEDKKEKEKALGQVGLPSGRDFVYCEESRITVHVWCWKSREYERNGRMKDFEKYLADHGVDTSKLGVGNNKSLFKFYQEVKEKALCSLVSRSAGPEADSEKTLLREISILKIRLIATVNKRKRVLMEAERYDAGGHKRSAGQLIVRKLRENDDWQAQVKLAITDRIGVHEELQEDCFSIDHEGSTYTEETVASKGFAGILSNYKIRTVPVHINEPDHEDLSCIGLPRGHDFVSKEYVEDSDQPNLHVWSWVPFACDGEEAEADTMAVTALEVTKQDLYEVENILTKSIAEPEIQSLGLDKPFKTSVQKLKQCAELLSNIDKTIQTVDVSGIMGVSEDPGSHGKPTASSALRSFIESNFVRGDAVRPSETKSKRRASMNFVDAGLDAVLDEDEDGIRDAQGFSLEQLFSTAPTVLQAIVAGRNEWNFDFFHLFEQCDSRTHALEFYGEVMLAPYFVIGFKCSETAAHNFAVQAASQYEDNPYHGPMHAAQVCHLARWLTKAMRVMENQSELEHTAFMISAFCHDMKHIGRNNNFCIVSEHPLALLYNNKSVLENFHSSGTLELLEATMVLKNMPLADRTRVRSHIIENILATDMAEHFETISKFRVRQEGKEVSPEDEDDRRFLARMCLKAGDLGHACLPWNLHVQWSTQMTKEFFSQGDEEKRLGLPISALCDSKDVNNLSKSQKGFLGFVVSPLYQAISQSQSDLLAAAEREKQVAKEPREASKESSSSPRQRRVSVAPAFKDALMIDQVCTWYLNENVRQWQDDTEVVAETIAKLSALYAPAAASS